MSKTTDPRVSVLVITYNHEKFVRQALDSVLMQRTSFDVEVVVADDYSLDSTVEILREYEAAHPQIRLLPTEGHLGISKNYRRGFDACRGEFITLIEGDDYWITPRKLEVLSDFMRRHPECALGFHRTIRLDEESELVSIHPEAGRGAEARFYTARQLAGGNFIGGLSTCIYRREVIEGLDAGLWKLKIREWPFNIVVAREGLIGYVPEVMSIYRAHSGGIWSKRPYAEKRAALMEVIEAYNEYLGFEFDAEFRALIRLLPPPEVLLVGGPPGGSVEGFGAPVSIYRRVARRAKPFVPPIFVTLARGVLRRARDFRHERRG